MQTISIQERHLRMARTPVIIDLREPMDFAAAHLPSSISMAVGQSGEPIPIECLPSDGEVMILGTEDDVQRFLNKIDAAFQERIAGIINGGIDAWIQSGHSIDMLVTIASDELAMDLPHDERILLLDVRTEAMFDEGHVQGAVSMPLDTLSDPGSMALLEDDCNIYIYGQSASDASTAASLIKRQGYHNLRALEEGWNSIRAQKGIRIEKSASRLN